MDTSNCSEYTFLKNTKKVYYMRNIPMSFLKTVTAGSHISDKALLSIRIKIAATILNLTAHNWGWEGL